MIILTKKISPQKTIVTEQITEIFRRIWLPKFKSTPTTNDLTEYEKAAGFTHQTRTGSRHFCNVFGHFMEDVFSTSQKFKKMQYGCDGTSIDALYELKSKYNTMKASQATPEITKKLEQAIATGKLFYLLIITDKKGGRNIPLHQGVSLSNIKDVSGYDPEKHRWVSGDEVYKLLYMDEWQLVKAHVLTLLKEVPDL